VADFVRINTLARALVVKGSTSSLARALRIPEQMLSVWLARKGEIPPDVYFRALDIVVAAKTDTVGARKD
jgi:hypothetical protein